MVTNEGARRRNIFDYIVIGIALLGFFIAYFLPAFFEGTFLTLFLTIFVLFFLTRVVVLIAKKSFGLHTVVFGIGLLVLLYLLYSRIG